MKRFVVEGIWAAVVTPFTNEGQLDTRALRALIESLISGGADGLLVLGGTGEGLALHAEERRQVMESAVETADGRVPVAGGILDPGLGGAVPSLKAAALSGVDAALVVTPYYVEPRQDGIVGYFQRLADSADIPLILYNIPYRTGVNLMPETVAEIVGVVERVVGVKECTRDLSQAARLIEVMDHRIAVMCGEETLTVDELARGADGAILATANLAPQQWHEIYLDVKRRAPGDITERADKLASLAEAAFLEPNPAPIKGALSRLYGFSQCVRPPLRPPSESVVSELMERLGRIRPLDQVGRS